MGIYSLSSGLAYGIGPVVGGLLNDHIAPVATWYGGLAMGLLAAATLVVLTRRVRRPAAQPGSA